MKTYIGIKTIQAEPCTKFEFIKKHRPEKAITFQPGNTDEDGYLVKYPDGYVSWSPKDVFEEAYVEVNPKTADKLQDMAKLHISFYNKIGEFE